MIIFPSLVLQHFLNSILVFLFSWQFYKYLYFDHIHPLSLSSHWEPSYSQVVFLLLPSSLSFPLPLPRAHTCVTWVASTNTDEELFTSAGPTPANISSQKLPGKNRISLMPFHDRLLFSLLLLFYCLKIPYVLIKGFNQIHPQFPSPTNFPLPPPWILLNFMCPLFIFNPRTQLNATFMLIDIRAAARAWVAFCESESLKKNGSPPSSHQMPIVPQLRAEVCKPLLSVLGFCLGWSWEGFTHVVKASVRSYAQCHHSALILKSPILSKVCARDHWCFGLLTAKAMQHPKDYIPKHVSRHLALTLSQSVICCVLLVFT